VAGVAGVAEDIATELQNGLQNAAASHAASHIPGIPGGSTMHAMSKLSELDRTSQGVVFASAAAALLVLTRIMSGAIVLLIWWGAALDTAQVVINKATSQYEPKVAFWLLVQWVPMLASRVPLLGR
jgi:hypothetical protein